MPRTPQGPTLPNRFVGQYDAPRKVTALLKHLVYSSRYD